MDSKASLKEILLAAFLYSGLTLLYFFPVLPSLSHSLIGPPEDNMQMVWFIWYGSQSLIRGDWPFMFSHLIYYPEGAGLYFANYYYYGIFLTLLLNHFWSLPLIFNLLVLHSFAFSGITAFLLLKYLTGDLKASLLGGFVYAFNPSHFAHSMHHVTIASIQFVPLFVLYFIKMLREERRSLVFWAAIFLALSGLCDWNYLVFGLVFSFLASLYLLFKKRMDFFRRDFKIISAMLLAAFVLLSPLVVPMVWIGAHHSFRRNLPGHDIFVADLFAFVTPSVYHWLTASWGRLHSFVTILKHESTDWEQAVYLGLMNLALIVFALRRTLKDCGKYFLALLAFMILAMGSNPHILGHAFDFPMPYRLLQHLPFFNAARNPSRIMSYGYLFLAILVAFSVQKMFSHQNRKTKAAFALLCVFIFLDFYSVCTANTPYELPAAYKIIQKDPARDFGILELPWDEGRYMMLQTLHEIPSVQGYLGRRVESSLGDTLTYDLRRLDEQKQTLTENKIKYIVLFKKRMTWDPSLEKDQKYLRAMQTADNIYARTYKKLFEDEGSALFQVYREDGGD